MDNIIEPKIIDVDIEDEMQKSFLAYSMSVIVSRALPDVRDGLKPVHRRILYTLFENGLSPDKAYRKCADTVGSVLGSYHPHGDASVYDALVRLAQNFSMRYSLVDGHGNFGSIDGDPPAAYRYTEARMSKISVEMLTDIDKDTVNFVPNYDDRLVEPEVLPSRFPNLLANGSTGIAVGMATNIPPHNLGEVIDAVCCLIDNPEADLSEIMTHIKGPDFPTGAKIMGHSGIHAAYATGRGKITVRACAEIVEEKNSRHKIVITELPYQVNKARLCENIAELVKDKKIEGITNIEDHSDRDGMHIRIDLKRDASPQIVLNRLYTFTQLQITFGVIMLAIVNGEPKILTLKQMLTHYINFQIEVLTRRMTFELNKAREKMFVLSGLMVAINHIDDVISILRSAKSVAEGKQTLVSTFELEDAQAQAVIQMRLGQLTGLERSKIEEDLLKLEEKIGNLTQILNNKSELLNVLKTEILEIKRRFSDERKTQIVPVDGEVDIEDLIPKEDCVLTLTNFGYVKRQKIDTYKLQNRGGKGVSGIKCRDEDVASEMFIINSHDYVLFFTNLGRVYQLKCYEVPEGSKASKGTNLVNLLNLMQNEKVTSMIKVSSFNDSKFLVMVTHKGIIKRTLLSEYDKIRKGGIFAINLDDDDELASVSVTDGSVELLIATYNGMIIRVAESEIRPSGRQARGVKAIKLIDEDFVVGTSIVCPNKLVFTVSETGFGRLTDPTEYTLQSRGGKGRINYNVKKYGNVAAIKAVSVDDDIIMISESGVIIRIAADSIRICSRISKGVHVMNLSEGDKIVAVASVPHSESELNFEKTNK